MDRPNIAHHSAAAKALHWLTAILVLIAFIYGPGGSEQHVYSQARDFDRQLHETLGLCVLALVALRIVWRALDTRPPPPPVARWMRIAAISGAWLEGHALTLLGGVTLPPAVAESRALGAQIAEVHTWLGDGIIWLAGVHALAGLFHHYILKDGVLRSMLPRRNSREA
jgi:cytochrome b561